jgi:hypothetical protein
MKVCIKSGIECNFYKHYYKNSSPCLGCDDNIMSNFKPKEAKMEKVQMTEEDFRNGLGIFLKEYYHIEIEECIRLMKLPENNLIKKSELQTLIDETESFNKNRGLDTCSSTNYKEQYYIGNVKRVKTYDHLLTEEEIIQEFNK